MSSASSSSSPASQPTGTRLTCSKCQAEIEIISPCTCEPPDQVFQCCGQPMEPSVGQRVTLGVE